MSKKSPVSKEMLKRLKTQGVFHRFRCGFCNRRHLAKFDFRDAVLHGGGVLVRADKVRRGCRPQWMYVPMDPMHYAIFVNALGLEHMLDQIT